MQAAEVKHILVTTQRVLGPLHTSEVIELLKKDPQIFHAILWISPEGQPPVLVMEWFTDYAGEGVLDEILAIKPAKRTKRVVTGANTQKNAELPPEHGALTAAENSGGRNTRLRDWFALLCLATFGIGLLWFGIKIMRPAQNLSRPPKTLSAKLLGATPDALRNYQSLLEGKIVRDPQKYARSLIALQKDRKLYPEGYLPADEMTAAIALVTISRDELDRLPEWKELLLRLPPEARQLGLSVVAYELSRVFEVRKNLLSLVGKEFKKSTHSKKLDQAFEELGIVLERMTRVVPQSEPKDRVYHGLLLSRLLSLSLVTVLEFPQTAGTQSQLKNALSKVEDLYPFISTADKTIIGEMLDAARRKIAEPKSKIDWSQKLQRLVELQKSNKFLCQLNETGAGGDSLLYLLTQAGAEKQILPEPANVFDNCFVGLRLYPRTADFSLDENGSNVIDYATAGSPDESLLRKYRSRFPTMSPALGALNGTKNSSGEWMLILYQNGVLPGRIATAKSPAQNLKCAKARSKSSMCAQIVWTESSGRWRDLVPLVLEFRDEIRPDELNLLAHNYIFNAAREVVAQRNKNRSKDIQDAVKAVKDFVDIEDPQVQFLVDYIQSLGVDS